MHYCRNTTSRTGKYIWLPGLLIAATLAGCATKPLVDQPRNGYYANQQYPAVGSDNRVKSLVMHYTALNEQASLKTLTTEQVSAHYLVPQFPPLKNGKPLVWQLVQEQKRAWHAGVSYWQGRGNLNESSIGIEIVNLGYWDSMLGHRHWYPYNQAQITLITALAKDIISRNKIRPTNVVAHSDIAPGRKQDPGPLFPWQQLAEQGIGAWPDHATVKKYLADKDPFQLVDVLTLQKTLHRYGYQIPQNGQLDKATTDAISAFQMHFRPVNFSGTPDAETLAIAQALVEKYPHH